MKTHQLAELECRIDEAIKLIHLWEDSDARLQPYWDQLLQILIGDEQDEDS